MCWADPVVAEVLGTAPVGMRVMLVPAGGAGGGGGMAGALEVSLVAILLTNMLSLASPDAKRLYDDLLRRSGYNKLIRPVGNTSDTLTVKLGLRLTQIIDVVSSHPNTLTSSHQHTLNTTHNTT